MKNISLILVSLALLGSALSLTGCATTGYANGAKSGVSYDKYHDSYGEYRIVSRNNDLYVEKLDGSEKRKITNTPHLREFCAHFARKGDFIVYGEAVGLYGLAKYYKVKLNGENPVKIEISLEEYRSEKATAED